MSSDDRRGGSRRHRSHEDRRRHSRSRSRSPRRPHRRRYDEELAAGLDGDLRYDSGSGRDAGDIRLRRSRSRSPPRPSKFLAIDGLPADADEAAVQALFAPVPGVVKLTLERGKKGADKIESFGNGRALLEMSTVAFAQSLMGSEWRDGAFFGQHRLRLSYSRPPPRGDESDWICPSCRGLNFGRRSECYQCRAPRTEAALAVPDPSAPSPCLRIANLERHTTEQDLEYAIKPHVPLRHVRIARERLSGASRGYAFATFASVQDATSALQTLNGTHIPGQKWKLRMSYAPDLSGPGHEGKDVAAEGDPLQATTWEPAAFDEAALESGDREKNGAAALSTGGLEYDAASGYMRELATGFLFDSATGLYFHPQLKEWGTREGGTGEFRPQRAQQRGQESAEGARKPAAKYVIQPEADNAAGAVIGAAPQVDPEAVRAAAVERARLKEEEEAAARGGLGTDRGQHQAAPQPGRPVQGILHKGSWAARRAQLQQQQQQQQG